MPRPLTHWLKPQTRRSQLRVEALEDRSVPALLSPGGTTTAVGDLDGDGFNDLIAAGGPGLGAIIQAYSGRTGQAMLGGGFNPYPGEDFTTIGLFVAAGDIDGDGRDELGVSPDQGGGARAQVFSLVDGAPVLRANFFAIEDPNFRGGARIAMGDVDGDGTADFVAGAGFLGGPRVAVYSGRSLADGVPARLCNDFFAFEPTLRDGVYTAAGDLTGDGRADLIFGGGPGGGPRVLAVDGQRLIAGDFDGAFAQPVANFFAFDENLRNGVAVAAANLDADPLTELVVGEGPDGGPFVNVFERDGTLVQSIETGVGFAAGLRVSTGDLSGDGLADLLASPASGPDRTVFAFGASGVSLFTLPNPFDPAATIPPATLPPVAPTLQLDLTPSTVTESAGVSAARLGITRTGGLSAEPLAAQLVASDPAGVTVPSEVFFAAGVTRVEVDIGVIDNTIPDGTRTVTLTASAAGVAPVSTTLTITDDDPTVPPVIDASGVLAWNDVLLGAIRTDASAPPVATRAMALVNLALYDVQAGFAGQTGYAVTLAPPAGASLAAAGAVAGHRVLSDVYPAQQATFDAERDRQLAAIPTGAARDAGVTYGLAIADAINAARRDDGYDRFVDYTPGTAVGDWEPTPPMFAEEQLPEWATVRPFALSSPSEFRAPAPPTVGSPEWLAAFQEVRALGDADRTRTADEAELPRLWADGAGTITPPGHWLQIALAAARERNFDRATAARLLASLGVALADASVATWETKFTYGTWRPITAIREADRIGDPSITPDLDWTPLLITPNHPEYVSGHSTYSRTAATVLEQFFGTAYSFSTTATALGMTVTRTYGSFDAAANDAGQSRILGGIHFQFSNTAGQALGRQVAARVLATFDRANDAFGPQFTFTVPPGQTRNTATVDGRVNDAQTGVFAMIAGVVGQPAVAVTLGTSGTFAFTPDIPADGPVTLRFTASDIAGNISVTDYPFVLDRSAPAVTVIDPIEASPVNGAGTLTGTVDGSGGSVVSLTYRLDEAGSPAMPIPFTPTGGAFSIPLDLSRATPGPRTVTVTATDAAGNVSAVSRSFNLTARPGVAVTSVLPANGATDIGVTYRPRVMFSRPVTGVSDQNIYAADAAGVRIPTRPVLSDDGSFAWVFFPGGLPGGSTVTLVIDGNGDDANPSDDIVGRADGAVLTGTTEMRFSTVSRTAGAELSVQPFEGGDFGTGVTVGTTVTGVVADTGPDLQPGTPDDVRAGPDGLLMTADDVYVSPLAGVRVFVLGRENFTVTTDANGQFTLAVPAGPVKLAIDGRTATNEPAGVFFPEMVMDLVIEPGVANTVMGSMGTGDQQRANEAVRGVYLPRLLADMMTAVDPTAGALIGAPVGTANRLTPAEQGRIALGVPAGTTMFNADGFTTGANQLGVSVVPVELVREMLPVGVPQGMVDTAITIQAPGIETFGTPLALTMPNTSGAAPGTTLSLFSFDHTTGRLEIEGTMTVSADGLTVTTDPGSGITHPGWHGGLNPGSDGGGEPDCDDETEEKAATMTSLRSASTTGSGSGTGSPSGSQPVQPTFVSPLFFADAGGQTILELPFAAPSGPAPMPGQSGDMCEPTVERVVEISDDGVLTEFLKLEGDVNESSFVLKAGDESKTLRLTSMTFDEMGGLMSFEENRVYGTTLTVRTYLRNGNEVSDEVITKYPIYRLIDATDDSESDLTLRFERTLTNVTTRSKPLDLQTGSESTLTPALDGGTMFSLVGSSAINFRPVGEPASLPVQTDTLRLTNSRGEPAVIIGLSGVPSVPVGWEIDEQELARIIDEKATGILAGTSVPGADVAREVIDRVGRLYQNAGVSEGIGRASATGFPLAVQMTQGPITFANPCDPSQTLENTGQTDGPSGEAVRQLVAEAPNLSRARLAYRLAEASAGLRGSAIRINTAFALSDSRLYFEFAVIPRTGPDVANRIVSSLGKVIAHELGHFIGVVGEGRNPSDVMAQDGDSPDFTLSRSFAGGAADFFHFALGLAWNPSQADRVVQYLSQETDAVDRLTPSDPPPCTPRPPIIGGGSPPSIIAVPRPFPVARAVAADGLTVVRVLDFGRMPVGAGPQTASVRLTNYSTTALEGLRVSVVSGGAVVAPDPAVTPTRVGGGEAAELAVRFTATAPGTYSALLRIDGAGLPAPLFLPITGSVAVAGPMARPTATDNNLGAARVGTTSTRADAVGVTNVGNAPLRITSVRVVEGANRFALTGVPADLATNPAILGFGERFTVGAVYTPDGLGLQRAVVEFTTDDLARPVVRVTLVGTGVTADPQPVWGRDFVAIDSPGGEPIRIVSDPGGRFTSVVPPAETVRLRTFDPTRGLYGESFVRTGASGQPTDLTATIRPTGSTAPDSDFDGLPDDIEDVIGLSTTSPDTDGDGTDDFREILTGTDPLGGRSAVTGVTARLPITVNGSAVDVRSVTVAGTSALLATGNHGLAVVDIADPVRPTVRGLLDLPGTNVDAAFDPDLGLAVVASQFDGLHLVDLADPGRPALRQTFSGQYAAVEVRDSLAYAASAETVRAVDLLAGAEIESVDLGRTVIDLARDGQFLYALTDLRQLFVIDVGGPTMTVRGSVQLQFGGGKLTAGSGLVYAAAQSRVQGGYATIDVTDPTNPQIVSESDVPPTVSSVGAAVAATGSGLALVVGETNTGFNALDLTDARDPQNTAAFLTRFELPGTPNDVAVGNGVGLVATGTAGLTVVNFRSADAAGQPPSVTITLPGVTNNALQEGSFIDVRAVIVDDVQVRAVELLVGGRVVRTDSSFPFDLSAALPGIAANGGNTITVQVRATDTGGNVGLSNTITLTLTPDTTPPALLSSDLIEGAVRGPGFGQVRLTFSEPLDPATVSAGTFTLIGPAGAVNPTSLRLVRRGTIVLLDYQGAPPGAYQFVVREAAVRDRAGNPAGATDRVTNFRIAPGRADLLAFLPFDGTVRDESGNRRHGSNGGAVAAAGFEGGSFEFNGASTFVRVPVDINPSVRPQLTMGAWAFIGPDDRIDGIRQVLSHDDAGFDRTFGIDSRSGGRWSVFGGSQVNQGSSEVPVRGVWTFLAAVYDQAAETVTFYVNDTVTTVTEARLGSGHDFLLVGQNPNFGEFFDGLIDNVFVFGSALTADEIADIRNRGSAAILGL